MKSKTILGADGATKMRQITVGIHGKGGEAGIKAIQQLAGMVDSGNGLYEPCTGLPVIVAYLPDLAGQAQVPIPVATVQGKQVLFGFRPQQLQANGTALEAWIALSPTPLQDVDALIPPGALPITTGE